MSRRRGQKRERKAKKKRRAMIRATKMMYRLKQISREDMKELVEFWETADDETVLRGHAKARREALVATGKLSPEEAAEERGP